MIWIRIALRRDIVKRSLKVGLLVGTILTLINCGDALLFGVASPALLWKIPLTYCVPYCVSTYASVSAVMSGDPPGGSARDRHSATG